MPGNHADLGFSGFCSGLLMSAVSLALKTYCDVTAAVLVGVKFAAQKMYDVHMRLVKL